MPYVVSAPTTREHLSFSQLSVAAACGEAYRRRYVDGERAGALTVPAVAGSAFHRATEDFEVDLRNFRPAEHQMQLPGAWLPDDKQAIGILTKRTKAQITEELSASNVAPTDLHHYGKQDMAHYYAEKIPGWASRYVTWRWDEEHNRRFRWAIDDDPSASIEIESLAAVAGHPFLSFIDQVFCDSRGRVVIRDLKTGGQKNAHAMQLEQYRVSLKRSHGIEAAYGQVLYLNKGKEATVKVVRFNLSDDEVDRMTGRLLRAIGEQLFLVNGPFNNECGQCEFSGNCSWGSVALAGTS